MIAAASSLAAPILGGAKANTTNLGLVGAIRWDAWFSPGSVATDAVERALAPEKYRWRAPFFAEADSDGRLHLPPLSQRLIDLEIRQANFAGIDYWAFVAYGAENSLSVALKYYLASASRNLVSFCFYTAVEYWGTATRPSAMIDDHLNSFGLSNYVRVQDGRPLYYLGFVNEKKIQRWGGTDGLAKEIATFRSRAISLGFNDPYIVLGGNPHDIGGLDRALGTDAITSYVITDGKVTGDYSNLTQIAELGWKEMASSNVPVVPIAMAGWDQRPRIENPGPWNQNAKAADVRYYFQQATPDQLAAHILRALNWNSLRPKELRAPTVLLYAWNEYDEGGWISPTLGCDTRRLEAIKTKIGSSGRANPKCGYLDGQQ
jgi:hypothetical protein